MSESAEDRVKAIGEIPERTFLWHRTVRAIRDAENAAYERAAKIAAHYEEEYLAGYGHQIAADILALAHKEGQ